MTNLPKNTQTATNSKASLLVGEDVTNQVFRNVAVDANGNLFITTGTPAGGPTTGVSKTVAVGVAAVPLLSANAARIQATVTNNGSTILYVGLTNAVVDGSAVDPDGGTRIFPGGSWSSDGYAGDIYAIGSASGGIAAVQEW